MKHLIPVDHVERRIHSVRGQRVMLDSDLAQIYGVSAKRLNEQVRRNAARFPSDFMFQLTQEEAESLRSQIATSNKGRGGRRYLPYVFTEHGTVMLSAVLRLVAGGPAATADGLKVNDQVVAVNGVTTNDGREIHALLFIRAGAYIVFRVKRDGGEKDVTLTARSWSAVNGFKSVNAPGLTGPY